MRGAPTFRRVPTPIALAAVGLAYWGAAWIGSRLAGPESAVPAVWPASGVAVAAVMLLGRRVLPAVLIGDIPVGIGASASWPATLAGAFGNALQAFVIATLVTRWAGGVRAFERPRDVARFVLLGAVAGTTIAASVGATSLVAFGVLPAAAFPTAWWTWWSSDVLSVLIVTPALVLWADRATTHARPVRPAEAAAAGLATALVAVLAFAGLAPGPWSEPGEALLIPLVAWAALRLGPRGVVSVTLTVTVVAVWGTFEGRGPFGVAGGNAALLELQAFVAVVSMAGLVMASVVASRDEAAASLRRLQADLERRIEERTDALRGSEQRFRQMAQSVEDAFWLMDVKGRRCLYMSPAYERVFGRSREGLYADPDDWIRALHPDDQVAVAEILRRDPGLKERGPYDLRVVHPDGRLRWVRSRLFPVHDASGRIVRITGVATDITDAKHAEESERALAALKAAETERTRLLNSVAHELYTPLTPLGLQLYMLRQRRLGDLTDRQEKAVAVLQRNVNRLSTLVGDVKDLARIEARALRLRPSTFDLAALLAETAEMYGAPAEKARVHLTCAADGSAPLTGDRDRLSQVLVNLVSNAVRFTPPGGSVALECHVAGAEATVRVRDTGVGLTPEQMARLFKPFIQVHDTQKLDVGGSGLGLYITKGLVEAHGGSIRAESDGPGRGACFVVTLPMSGPPAGQPGSTTSGPVTTPSGHATGATA